MLVRDPPPGYHLNMVINRSAGMCWYYALGVAGLPWVWLFKPAWAAGVVVMVLIVHRSAVESTETEPWRTLVTIVSAFFALVYAGGWAIAVGWLVPAVAVGVSVWSFPIIAGWSRPDLVDVAAGAALASAFATRPELIQADRGGWVAPVILILGVRRFAMVLSRKSRKVRSTGPLRAPTRDVRGTLSFSGAVSGSDGLQRTVPLDLEIRAGSSLAILCDDGTESRDLAEALAGRRPPFEGHYCVDGVPMGPEESLVAFVGLGEPFLVGNLEENVAGFGDAPLNSDQKAAVWEACALSEVEEALKDAPIRQDGRPLDPHHRLMVQLARVAVSHYRLLVVLDPMVSVNPIRSELWRTGVVRASVGRTAVWVTPDRDLAQRAEQVMALRHGTLKEVEARLKNGGE